MGIVIRVALSSVYGPSPNTGQSFFEKLGQNSDILRTNFEIPNTCSFSFVFGIFTKSKRSCSVCIMFVFGIRVVRKMEKMETFELEIYFKVLVFSRRSRSSISRTTLSN